METSSDDNVLYTRTVYPGTWGNNKIDNLVLDSIVTVDSTSSKLVYNSSQNIGKLTIKNTNITKSYEGSYVYIQSGAVPTASATIDSLIFENCDIDVSIGSYGIVTAYEGNTTYPSILNYLKLIDCNLVGSLTNNTPILGPVYRKNLFSKIELTNTQIDSLERLIIVHDSSKVDIVMDNCSITNAKYFVPVTLQYDTVSVATASNCLFNNPSSYLFYNEYENSPFTLNLSHSSGDVITAKIKNGTTGFIILRH